MIDLEKCTDNYLNSIIEVYIKIINKYPEVMKEYLNENREYNFNIEYERYWNKRTNGNRKKASGKDNGKLFATYIWCLIKNEKNESSKFALEKTETTDYFEINENNIHYNNTNKIGKNVIIYGVPGSGKSYFLKKKITSRISSQQFERIIFYPEYMYYDFVGQKVPSSNNSGLEFEPGPFARILKKAISDTSDKHYYLIIEELNRGNAEAIFGDILQLLDRRSDGKSEYEINNQLLKDYINKNNNKKIDKIYLPANLSIYATINNSDQNVFTLDTAFSRRWEFEGQSSNPKENELDEVAKVYFKNKIVGTEYNWNNIRKKINKVIISTEDIYNREDKQIGLFYIDKDGINNNIEENIDYYRQKFASKIFRYLWLDIFRNCRERIFYLEEINSLEELINKFKITGRLNNILKIELEDEQDETEL